MKIQAQPPSISSLQTTTPTTYQQIYQYWQRMLVCLSLVADDDMLSHSGHEHIQIQTAICLPKHQN